jgi:ribA/ribD-fused uncharacterized protein
MAKVQMIGFWGISNPNGYFSQWYPSEFIVDKVKYLNAEQYMMAEKAKLFGDEEIRKVILATKDPRKCKDLGRKIKNFDEKKWIENREKIVFEGSLAKFSQNEELKRKLLDTEDAILVEASPTDSIWGIGMMVTDPNFNDQSKWKGLNLLGKALMRVRDKLKSNKKLI